MMPLFGERIRRHLATREGLSFHLQVNLGIDMGRVERHVPEPRADGIDIYPGTEEMYGCGMPIMPCTALPAYNGSASVAVWRRHRRHCAMARS